MKKVLQIIILIGVMLTALPLSVSADAYPYFGPQGLDDDFLWFGDADYPRAESQGITLNVDLTSTSFQSIIGQVTFDKGYIEERQITRFFIMANDRVVDSFDPAWDESIKAYKRSYPLRIRLESWNTGSFVNLQVVAVHDGEVSPIDPNYNNLYVVGWSNKPPGFLLKDMPVYDEAAVSWLEAIYKKLDEMKASIEGKLDKLHAMIEGKLGEIDKSIKKIYEVKPETQAAFDAALAELQAKLPTEQMKEEANEMQKVIDDSANRIKNAPQVVKYGQLHWMFFTTSALDFTDFMDEITTLRRVLQIILWCEFFYAVILVLRPRLTV